MRCFKGILKAGSVALALSLSAALVLTVAMPDAAYAKGKESKGGGDKGSKGKDKSSKAKDKSKKSKDKAKASSAKKPKKAAKATRASAAPKTQAAPVKRQAVASAVVAEEVAAETEAEDAEVKNIRAALGALNAANASETALANASPNSRVGRIAAYRDQVLLAQELERDVEEAEALLAASEAPELTAADYSDLLAAQEERRLAIEIEIAEINTALNAVGGENEELLQELAEAEAALVEQNETLGALQDDYTEASSYWDAQDALAAQTDALEAEQQKAMELLDDAANKPVTEAVVAEVNRLLGLNAE